MKRIILTAALLSEMAIASGRQALIDNLEAIAGEKLRTGQKEFILHHPDLVLPPANEVDEMFKGISLPSDEGLKLCYEKCTTKPDGEKVCHKVCLSD